MLNLKDSNELISDLINIGKPFSVCRIGIGELNLLYKIINNQAISKYEILKFKNFGGVYGDCFTEFIHEYILSVTSGDIQCYWEGCGLDTMQNEVYKALSPHSQKITHKTVEPYFLDNPWSNKLSGKNVLVVHPFITSIKQQYKNRVNIWENNKILPEFNLITYKAIQSFGDLNPHSSWVESLNIMKNDISKIDFDIALLGCGCYGLPLVNYIKGLNKIAIYVGGALQIMFGIKGKRWDKHETISKFYNNHWIRPSSKETCKNYRQLENGCYW